MPEVFDEHNYPQADKQQSHNDKKHRHVESDDHGQDEVQCILG